MSKKIKNEQAQYMIVYPPGANGRFVKNFLDVDFMDTNDNKNLHWLHDLIESSYIHSSHDKNNLKNKISIGIVPTDFNDLLTITINRILKSDNLYLNADYESIDFFDKVLISAIDSLSNKKFYFDKDIFSTDYDIVLPYKKIFNIEFLKELYYKINKIEVVDSKIIFAKNYIEFHENFYQSCFYKALCAILKFEYINQLFDKTRIWSINCINLRDATVLEYIDSILKIENYY